ncbi:hypothetical protein QTP88_014302 [Uroleucon formosanum]
MDVLHLSEILAILDFPLNQYIYFFTHNNMFENRRKEQQLWCEQNFIIFLQNLPSRSQVAISYYLNYLTRSSDWGHYQSNGKML